MTLIAPTLQAFFSDRLARQLQASPRTIASLDHPGFYGDRVICFSSLNF
jgi:hypothetical protein